MLDVKTGRLGDESAEHRARGYERQVQTYASVTEAITGAPVDRFTFVFGEETGTVVHTVALDDQSRPTMKEELADASRRLTTGGRALAADRRTCLSCGYLRVGWCPGVT